jgi:hypothetical protein
LGALDVAWSMQIALFQHQPWPKEIIRPSVCRKKSPGLGQGEWGLMQATNRGFRGVGCAIRLGLEFLGC